METKENLEIKSSAAGKSKGKKGWTLAIAFLSLVASYILMNEWAVKLGIMVWAAGLIVVLVKKRWILAAALVVLFPINVLTAFTTYEAIDDYFSGRAVLKFSGYTWNFVFNLDPELRMEPFALGCLVFPDMIITRDYYNFVVRSMIENLGPMPGSYQGPYPERNEAYKIIRDSPDIIAAEDFLKGQFEVDGKIWRLDPKTAESAIQEIKDEQGFLSQGKPGMPRLKVKILDGQCLLVATDPLQIVVLIDIASSRIFARYIKSNSGF